MSKQRGTSFSTGSPLAVAIMFFGAGFGMASTYSRMPGFRDQLGSSPAQLAFALVCMGIGSILGMPFTGRLVERYSSRIVSLVATILFLGGCALLPLADSLTQFGITLLIAGIGAGVGDVAMNVQGNLVEARRRKVLMPYWHGIFSIGAVAGALCGSLAASIGLPLAWHLPSVSLVLLVLMWLATTRYVHDGIPHSGADEGTLKASSFGAPPPLPLNDSIIASPRQLNFEPIIILLGIMTFATALGEGAANDWLALMLVDNRGAPPAVGALTYAGFNLTMALGRFTGGVVIHRYGRVPVLRLAGTLACVGVTALCLINSTLIALIGAFAWGLGLSVVFPAAMSAAGEVPGRSSRAIAKVATIGYGGFLVGAPLIGLLAHVMPLDKALLAVAGVVLLIAFFASAARERSREVVTSKAEAVI
jgi:MFS family permease